MRLDTKALGSAISEEHKHSDAIKKGLIHPGRFAGAAELRDIIQAACGGLFPRPLTRKEPMARLRFKPGADFGQSEHNRWR